jgi:hypothetical protein
MAAVLSDGENWLIYKPLTAINGSIMTLLSGNDKYIFSKKDDPVQNRRQPKPRVLNQQDRHCADGRTVLFARPSKEPVSKNMWHS